MTFPSGSDRIIGRPGDERDGETFRIPSQCLGSADSVLARPNVRVRTAPGPWPVCG